MKITTIIGVRPEIIKMSQLIPLLDKNFDHLFIFTGQHFSGEMADIFFEQLGVRQPDVTLNIKSSEYSDSLPVLKKELKKNTSDYVIVYGDTSSTLAGALAAQKYNKKLIHIESGLRSFDERMAEELIRVLVDHISNILFTPTSLTASFLEKEGIVNGKHIVGNTVVDACLKFTNIAEKESKILDVLNLDKEQYIFSTVHRPENVDNMQKLLKILHSFSLLEHPVVLPLHPRIKLRLSQFGYKLPSNIIPSDPVSYFDALKLLKNSIFTITDSGGIQEEAITLKIPCLTLRETTERWETVGIGANFLVGSDPLLINYHAKMILETNLRKKIEKIKNPYGGGTTSEKILNILKNI